MIIVGQSTLSLADFSELIFKQKEIVLNEAAPGFYRPHQIAVVRLYH